MSKDNTRLFLTILGILWLILAGAILIFQIAGNPQIDITWTTETEFETAGFNIYRSELPDGEYVQINSQLLPSEGDVATGASYSYTDVNVAPGKKYYYKLEEVEYDNSREQYDLGSGENPFIEGWALLLAATSVIVGLFLLVTAIKQENKQWTPKESQNPTQTLSGEP